MVAYVLLACARLGRPYRDTDNSRARTVNETRPDYGFNESCQGTVPEAIVTFLDLTRCKNAGLSSVFLGGVSDKLASITGGIAEAFYCLIQMGIGRVTPVYNIVIGPLD